ncbi:MAG: NUDIX domain-containing protein [Anaerolineae bacterium]|nr:NUDIX domain-containing protein [Anaerolineae bacterium]
MSKRVRPIAICAIEDQDRLFVFEARDTGTGTMFYRPLGGGIEFGERGADCVARELREEIAAEVTDVTYLGMIENIFTCNGEAGHEIVLVYRARFADPAWARRGSVEVHEEEHVLTGRWMPLAAFRDGTARLVPVELLDMLEGGNRDD